MEFPLSKAKILKTEFSNLLFDEAWLELLTKGNFYEFEKLLYQQILNLYDQICEELVNQVSSSKAFVNAQKSRASEEGLKKLEFRDTHVRLRTGTKINYPSLYAKVAPQNMKVQDIYLRLFGKLR